MTHGRTPLAFTEDGGLGRDMNPDVVSAIARLRRDNVLGQAQATLFDRVARRRLVSVRFEIRALLYAGVLLVVGVAYLLGAYLWDSRTILGLALTTLAAWRGVSISLIQGSLPAVNMGNLRVNAVVLGALYVAAAALSVRLERKAHFEEVFANAGLLLLLGGLVSGVFGSELNWGVWLAALLVVAGLVMWLSFPLRRSLYFAQGIVAVYVGLLRLLFEPFRHHVSGLPFFLAAVLGLGALVLILAAHRRMRER